MGRDAVPLRRGRQRNNREEQAPPHKGLQLVLEELLDCGGQVLGLGQDYVFELGLVGAERVHGGDALYRGVELVKELLADAGGDFRAVAAAEHVFVGDDDAMIFADGGGDRFPIVGRERAKVDDFDGDAFALELRGSDFGAMHDGAVGDDADVGAFFDEAGFAERDGVIGTGIFGAIVRLAVEMFVLEEHHRVVAADRGAQQAGNVERGGGHDDAQARAMREDRFAALAVIDAAAGEIAADGDANHRGAFEVAVGAPAR